MSVLEAPIPDSYWVWTGRLLAGEYPGARDANEAREKLRRLIEAGVTFFLDLTEESEHGLNPYAPILSCVVTELGCQVAHCRTPIPDNQAPSREEMIRILDVIDQALEDGHVVYVHCYGGIGRTGTVVGCYLARHGLAGEEALSEIAHLRQSTPDGWRQSPETRTQREMVQTWPIGQ